MLEIFGHKNWFQYGFPTSIGVGTTVVETFAFLFESNDKILFEDGSGVSYGG